MTTLPNLVANWAHNLCMSISRSKSVHSLSSDDHVASDGHVDSAHSLSSNGHVASEKGNSHSW